MLTDITFLLLSFSTLAVWNRKNGLEPHTHFLQRVSAILLSQHPTLSCFMIERSKMLAIHWRHQTYSFLHLMFLKRKIVAELLAMHCVILLILLRTIFHITSIKGQKWRWMWGQSLTFLNFEVATLWSISKRCEMTTSAFMMKTNSVYHIFLRERY